MRIGAHAFRKRVLLDQLDHHTIGLVDGDPHTRLAEPGEMAANEKTSVSNRYRYLTALNPDTPARGPPPPPRALSVPWEGIGDAPVYRN